MDVIKIQLISDSEQKAELAEMPKVIKDAMVSLGHRLNNDPSIQDDQEKLTIEITKAIKISCLENDIEISNRNPEFLMYTEDFNEHVKTYGISIVAKVKPATLKKIKTVAVVVGVGVAALFGLPFG